MQNAQLQLLHSHCIIRICTRCYGLRGAFAVPRAILIICRCVCLCSRRTTKVCAGVVLTCLHVSQRLRWPTLGLCCIQLQPQGPACQFGAVPARDAALTLPPEKLQLSSNKLLSTALAALRTRAAISADAHNGSGWHQPCKPYSYIASRLQISCQLQPMFRDVLL